MNAAAIETGLLSVLGSTDGYPDGAHLSALLKRFDPELILLDVAAPEEASCCLLGLQSSLRGAQVIAVGGTPIQQRALAAQGIDHSLPYPPESARFRVVIRQAISSKHSGTYSNLFAFLPAKAGSGCSTLALCTGAALAGIVGTRTLCIEADFDSGVLASATGRGSKGSVQSALVSADELDDLRWHVHINQCFGVDFLLSAETTSDVSPEWADYFRLLNFTRSRYDSILVDLPEAITDSSQEVVRRADSVFVVVTQELQCLRLALRRIDDLARRGVSAERIRILVNRWDPRETDIRWIQDYLGRKVAMRFPDDRASARAILRPAGLPLSRTSCLGKALASFAREIAGVQAPESSISEREWFGKRRLLALRTQFVGLMSSRV